MKPTALQLIAKPEFIANVDTANEEVVRVVDQYNALVGAEGRLVKAEAQVETLTAQVSTMITAEAHKVATDEVTRLTAEAITLKDKADKAGAAAITTIAASGIDAPAKVAATDPLKDTKVNTDGLTGLARAMAANQAIHAAKSAK